MITQLAPPADILSHYLNTLKELIRRQKQTHQTIQQFAKVFLQNIEKTDEFRAINPIINMVNIIHEWLSLRLIKPAQFLEQVLNKKGSRDSIMKQERNICIEASKQDVTRLKELKKEILLFETYISKDYIKKTEEFDILKQVCIEEQIDYSTVLESILKIKEDSMNLHRVFRDRGKSRSFIYEFLLKHTKRKVLQFELILYICEESHKITKALSRNSNGQVNFLKNDLQKADTFLSIQNLISFQAEIHQDLGLIFNLIEDIIQKTLIPVKNKYASYMQIILELQKIIENNCFHDTLISKFSTDIAETVRLNVMRDNLFNLYLVDVVHLIVNHIKSLQCKANQQLQNILSNADQIENQEMLKEGEKKWIDMILNQEQLLCRQQLEYKFIIQSRKQHYLNDQARFINSIKVQLLSPLTLQITAREFYKLFIHNEQFELQFRTQVLKQVQIKCSPLDPEAPQFYQHEESGDLKSIIDQAEASKRVITYKRPSKDKFIFITPDYTECKQEDYIYFMNDKELMIEQETFIQNLINSDYFTIRKYLYVQQQSDDRCLISAGYYRHETNFNLLSIIDFRFTDENISHWEQELQPAMIKVVQQYLQCKEQLKEERKKLFIFSKNIDSVLLKDQSKQNFMQDIPLLKRINQQQQQWSVQKYLDKDYITRLVLILIIFYMYQK